MQDAYICDAVRSPIGRFGGALSTVRADDLAAHPLKALMARHPDLDWTAVDEVVYGAANQAGEDNRNIARMALLLAGLPQAVPGITLNRLCASRNGSGDCGLAHDQVRRRRTCDSRRLGKHEPRTLRDAEGRRPFSRKAEIYDTTIGWRFVNRQMKTMYGTDSMPETGENVAERWQISREDQDAFALLSQRKAGVAMESGRLAAEIEPVTIPQRKGDPWWSIKTSIHGRRQHWNSWPSCQRHLSRGRHRNGGNASGVNDGSAAMILASENAMKSHALAARARVVAAASAGVEPAIMGIWPRARDAERVGESGPEPWRHGRDRNQRGLRGAGSGVDARPRHGR